MLYFYSATLLQVYWKDLDKYVFTCTIQIRYNSFSSLKKLKEIFCLINSVYNVRII